jgi:C4-type Zn-finger protein
MEQQYFINMLQILDASVERGTWKGGEIETIAGLRKQTLEKIKEMAEASQQEEAQVESITKKIGEK